MPSPPSPLPPRVPAEEAATAGASLDGLRAYVGHLDGMSLSEAQKLELLRALWSILSAFVDLGFGSDPVQQVLQSAKADTDRTPPVCPSRRAN